MGDTLDLLIGEDKEAETETVLGNKCMDSKGEGSGKNWEIVMHTYILPMLCIK